MTKQNAIKDGALTLYHLSPFFFESFNACNFKSAIGNASYDDWPAFCFMQQMNVSAFEKYLNELPVNFDARELYIYTCDVDAEDRILLGPDDNYGGMKSCSVGIQHLRIIKNLQRVKVKASPYAEMLVKALARQPA